MELKCRTLRAFSGKFLKFQKSAGLKYLINVMFGRGRGMGPGGRGGSNLQKEINLLNKN